MVLLPSVPTAHPQLQAIQQAASVQPQVTNQPSAASQQLLPWEADQHVVTQWGAARPVSSITPMPSAVPTALASAFTTTTATPSRLGRNPDHPLPPVTAKLAASISAPRRRRKMEPAEKPKARQGVPISYKKLYVIPVATITHLTEQVKFACSVSNLAGHPNLHNAMTDKDIRQEIRNFFTKDHCGIDWRVYSPDRLSGPLLWPTNLNPLPTGKDLAQAYQGKQLLIIRLNGTANIPAFEQNLKQAKVEFRKASGSSRSRVRRHLSDNSDNVIKSFTCKGCDGTFELHDRALHEEKCPARLPRKRKISTSTSSRHSRHHSEPPDVSPVATRKTKRIRAKPALLDGEIETRARASKKFQPKAVATVEETDVEGLGEEELDELCDDPLADEDELELGGMGSYRESSLEIYGGRDGDSEDEDDEDQEEEDAAGLDAALDDKDFDPTYQAADSGKDKDEDKDEEGHLSTSVGAQSGPSRSRTKGSYLWR
ncbi:hypothetical protein FRC04_005958 [Tulasnella sp. 424]|nr:hypothetical protein FRC04_005958 [Tulasnella sp. 424]